MSLPGWLDGPDLVRIWAVLRERVEARGLRAQGRVVLSGLSRGERRAAAGLLGRPVNTARVAVDLAELDARLRARSGIGGLLDILAAATGYPLHDRPALRAERNATREAPAELARARLTGLPWTEPQPAAESQPGVEARCSAEPAPWVEPWLDGARRAGVLGRASDPITAMARALDVLDRLRTTPGPTSRTELAAAIAGGAHGLDEGGTTAQLVLRALAAQAGEPVPTSTAGRRALWERAGVCADAVSTTCLTLGLRATGAGSAAARLALAADAGDPIHLTAWDLRRCTLAAPATVLVCENPRVLEAIAEGYRGAVPTVCTSGQPTLVVLEILRALTGAELRYHGDFDWPGVAIANRLIAEVGVVPWRMGAADYEAGVAPGLLLLSGAVVEPVWDAELGAAMRHRGVAVHEEAVLEQLLAEMAGQVSQL